ncbi:MULTISPECIES: hypothetical protein [Pseudoalteromonas]|uniref:Uncharacterized protein n=1 Tax=Pseudoalteromonas obscura TaxID=3048491 RepID=A0ABT7EJG8_9GAMM|nr:MULTISPECIES: hypothetical protein [Pseudoalteromonas]MBQ4836755.1 hypothetical protein [Pseudoalteromonas luteoviolacea]MDK2595183.1 hypothetical protein [Pseudoalteromonas sp. P94(2023)]
MSQAQNNKPSSRNDIFRTSNAPKVAQGLTEEQIAEQWRQVAHNMFVLRQNGEIVYLDVDFYTQGSRLIEWVHSEQDIHKFFLNEDNLFPLNLMGPAVTKVIPWNLAEAKDKLPTTFAGQAPLKPGYMIDLRVIQLNRLNANDPNFARLLNSGLDIPIQLVSNSFDPIYPVPHEFEHQLSAPIEEENLYIVSFKNPERIRGIDDLYGYQISYISKEELDNVDKYVPNEDDKNEALKLDELKKEHTGQYLERYYGDTNAQIGAINPRDMAPHLLGAACYIANLRTMKKD